MTANEAIRKNSTFTRRELTMCTIFGAVLAAGGLFFLLHGVLSLMGGGFGLERHVMDARGAALPSIRHVFIEIVIGSAVLVAGVVLRVKAQRIRSTMEPTTGTTVQSSRYQQVMNGLNIAAIVLSLLWIVYMIVFQTN